MKVRGEAWYLGQRAESLAMVLLTRRPGLQITRPAEDGPVDLFVEIARQGRATGRRFAIQLKAQVEPLGHPRTDRARLEAEMRELGEFAFPACVFILTMRDEGAYYAWAVEPVVVADGRPGLKAAETQKWHPLDGSALDMIVAQVDRWYEALAHSLAA